MSNDNQTTVGSKNNDRIFSHYFPLHQQHDQHFVEPGYHQAPYSNRQPFHPYASPYAYQQPGSASYPRSAAGPGVDVLYQGAERHRPEMKTRRPTLDNLTPSESLDVNTPKELLDHCCRFPACYDPLFELCIDTCRKCETEYPVTSWLPCPSLLNIPDCTSNSLSQLGRLPLACYPDIGPFANIIPISTVMNVPNFFEVRIYDDLIFADAAPTCAGSSKRTKKG